MRSQRVEAAQAPGVAISYIEPALTYTKFQNHIRKLVKTEKKVKAPERLYSIVLADLPPAITDIIWTSDEFQNFTSYIHRTNGLFTDFCCLLFMIHTLLFLGFGILLTASLAEQASFATHLAPLNVLTGWRILASYAFGIPAVRKAP